MNSQNLNSTEYFLRRNGGDLYILGLVDNNGSAVPIGLPKIVELSNDGKIRHLSTEDAFEDLDNI